MTAMSSLGRPDVVIGTSLPFEFTGVNLMSAHRTFTYDDLPKAITPAETQDDLAGYWYAFGRLDQGHAPVAEMAHIDGSPSATSTAWLFGSMWMAAQREFRDVGGYSPGIERAWDNFVTSGGRTVQRTR